ncbi:nuclear transport factor 2 family protein [Methylobacterium brachiatum]
MRSGFPFGKPSTASLEATMGSGVLRVVQDWYRTANPDLLSPEIEWRVLESFPSGGIYRGRNDVVDRFFPSVKAHFSLYETHPKTFMADGETVITTGHYRIASKFGVPAEADFAHVWTVRDASIVAFRQIADTAAINAHLGRS